MILFSLVDALPMAETSQTQNLSAIIGGSGRKSNSHFSPSLFKISSDGPNSVGFTKQQAFPLGRQDYHSELELDGGPIAIYYSDNNMV